MTYRSAFKYVHIHFKVKCFCCVAMRVKEGRGGVGTKIDGGMHSKWQSTCRAQSDFVSDSGVLKV